MRKYRKTMLYLIFTRIAAFTLMAALSLYTSRAFSISAFLAVLLGHYAMQILYSPKQADHLIHQIERPGMSLLSWLLLAFVFLLAQRTPYLPMPVFFGIHFLFTEIYTGRLARTTPSIRWLRILANACIYALCMKSTREFSWISPSSLYLGMALSGGGLIFSSLKNSEVRKLLVYDCVGFAFALWLPSGRLELNDIIFYHLAWWAIYPLRTLRSSALLHYVGLSSVITGALFAITPLIGIGNFSIDDWVHASSWLGNLHITLSFALSISNPVWINRLFQPGYFHRMQNKSPQPLDSFDS